MNLLQGTREGTVKWFNDKKLFGFIKDSSGIEVFVHITDTQGGVLKEGMPVKYEVVTSKKGHKAVNVVTL